MKKLFGKKILILGCGSVCQCALPLLIKDLKISPSQLTIVDFVDNRHFIGDAIKKGVNYVMDRITPDNLNDKLSSWLKPGDLLIDLAWNIDCIDITRWCNEHQVLYINTSVEVWEPALQTEQKHPTERTLYARHQKLQKASANWKNKTTMVLEHGANPGLVSHFVKDALIDLAKHLLSKKTGLSSTALEDAISQKDFKALSYLTQTKVIHISERDTQIINRPKEPNEFVNTWSVDGLYEESIAPAELGWGTHEKTLPPNAFTHLEGPQNQICLAQMGMHTWVRSWVPSGEIIGMVIRHGEAFTLSRFLTLEKDNKIIYRPTVNYAYCIADYAVNSLHELAMRNYVMQPKQRIVSDEIISGADELGVLLMGHDAKAWWTGSVLSIEEARNKIPNQNATTLQVAAGLIGAILWMIENPEAGLCTAEQLPHEFILYYAKPYLGEYYSLPVDWTPLKNRKHYFAGFQKDHLKPDDIWQFESFLHR